MILSTQSGTLYLNVSLARSRAGAHIMLSKNTPVPALNGPVLTIAQVIKNVMSSAAEVELSGLFIWAKAMIPLRNTLMEMGWPQPPSPVQCDNSTSTGVTNKNMLNKMLKSMDMRLWWLWCRYSQDNFLYYWAPGNQSLAKYSTKHHPPPVLFVPPANSHRVKKSPHRSLQWCVANFVTRHIENITS